MEPTRQVEIQLGHLCNNRCVFCVSGQMSERRVAGQIPAEPVIRELRAARASGVSKVTFLGGEPTIQRSFLPALKAAKELGFDEIVIFTNGVMTPRRPFVERVLALGRFTWRFSIQGGTEAHHDAVTRKRGSFARIAAGMRLLRERGQRLTANGCITSENVESLPHYPALVREHGIEQLHLDMVRPLDAGDRDDDYLASILPRYSEMREPLRRMLEGFPEDFDVNVGNYPYCLLPEWAHRIHHDGEWTLTIAADGRSGLSAGWNKYETKRRDKTHPEACDGCVFRRRCNGLFSKYQELRGTDEVRGIAPQALVSAGQGERLFTLLMEAPVLALQSQAPPPPWQPPEVRTDEHRRRIQLVFGREGGGSPVSLELQPPLAAPDAPGLTPWFALSVSAGLEADPPRAAALAAWTFSALATAAGVPAERALDPSALAAQGVEARRMLRYVEVLREAGRREGWLGVEARRTPEGVEVEILAGAACDPVTVQLHRLAGGRVGVSYRAGADPSAAQRQRLQSAMRALKEARPGR